MDPALPLQQHPRFAQALTLIGQRAEAMTLRDEKGRRLGKALVVRRRVPVLGDVAYLPRGPIWDVDAPCDARADALAASGAILVEAEAPCPSLRLAGFRAVVTPAHVAELALAGDPASRRAALDGQWRGHLRQAERSGLTLRREAFDGDPAHWLLAREALLRRERRYRTLPQAVACAFARTAPGAARLLVAIEDGEQVAGMLFLLHPPVATYHIGWTGLRGRALSAHHLLMMAAADDLAGEGFSRLDLGTIDAEASPGLARFKAGLGATVRTLGGSWLRLPFARRLALRGPSRYSTA